MAYFDVRPSSHAPTLELRVCDACPVVDDAVLIAGLFRAAVRAAEIDIAEGRPYKPLAAPMHRAALWQAARGGLSGNLLDHSLHPRPVPAADAVWATVERLAGPLAELGDEDEVRWLAEAALARGNSADRQRAAYAERGRLERRGGAGGGRDPRARRRSTAGGARAAPLPFPRGGRGGRLEPSAATRLRGARRALPPPRRRPHRRTGAGPRRVGRRARRHVRGGGDQAALHGRPDAPDRLAARVGGPEPRAGPARPRHRGVPARRVRRAAHPARRPAQAGPGRRLARVARRGAAAAGGQPCGRR